MYDLFRIALSVKRERKSTTGYFPDIVKQRRSARVGDDTLAEVVGEALSELAAKAKVEVLAVQSVMNRILPQIRPVVEINGVVSFGNDIKIGTDFQFQRGEAMGGAVLRSEKQPWQKGQNKAQDKI